MIFHLDNSKDKKDTSRRYFIMDNTKVNQIDLKKFFSHITPESYIWLSKYLHKSGSQESAQLLDILEGIRDLYLSYSGEDLANNFKAVRTFEDFVNLIYMSNHLGMDCASLCKIMGAGVKPCRAGMNIYAVKYGCIKAVIADTIEGIAILKPVMVYKMGQYIPLTDQEIEAAGMESETEIPGSASSKIPAIMLMHRQRGL